jgi:hypothetical protein
MARYDHLPLYKSLYTFSKEIYRTKNQLPKSLKHDLGAIVFTACLRMLRLLVIANGSSPKKGPLSELALEVQTLWTFLRLMYDLKGISKGQFGVLCEHLEDIQKQVTAWINWEKKQALEKITK